WAGFFANWLAISEAYIFLTLLLRFLRTMSRRGFVLLTLMSIAMLLTHPWTGMVVLTVASVFVLSVWRDSRQIILAKALFVLLSITTVIYVTKDRKSTRLNSSHVSISYAVFCLKKKI